MHRSVWISDTSKNLRVLGTCADAGFLPRGGVPRGKKLFSGCGVGGYTRSILVTIPCFFLSWEKSNLRGPFSYHRNYKFERNH